MCLAIGVSWAQKYVETLCVCRSLGPSFFLLRKRSGFENLGSGGLGLRASGGVCAHIRCWLKGIRISGFKFRVGLGCGVILGF